MNILKSKSQTERNMLNLVMNLENFVQEFERCSDELMLRLENIKGNKQREDTAYDEVKLESRFKKIGDEIMADIDKKMKEVTAISNKLESSLANTQKSLDDISKKGVQNKINLDELRKNFINLEKTVQATSKPDKMHKETDSMLLGKIQEVSENMDSKIESKTGELYSRIEELSSFIETIQNQPRMDSPSREEIENELMKIRADIKNRMRTFEEVVASKVMELSERQQCDPVESEISEENGKEIDYAESTENSQDD